MRSLIPYCVLCMLAGFAPLGAGNINFVQASQAFPGWPVEFEGRPLRQLPLSDRESLFLQSFPGSIARFTDGQREYIIRWLSHATRKLHAASDCLRGVGYRIQPLPIETREDQRLWKVFRARKGEETLRVFETIYDQQGKHWTDVWSWYWAALLGNSEGPWWSVTIAQMGNSELK